MCNTDYIYKLESVNVLLYTLFPVQIKPWIKCPSKDNYQTDKNEYQCQN